MSSRTDQGDRNDDGLIQPMKALSSNRNIPRRRELIFGEETKETIDTTLMTINGERMEMSGRKQSAASTFSPHPVGKELLEITKEEI